MIRFGFLLFLVLMAKSALAETATVQSGEHSNFSRLVVRFQGPTDWRAGRVEGGFELRSSREKTEYDLSKVFDLIPRDRVAALTDRGAGVLYIEADCECHIEVFDLQPGFVVLDLKDGDAPQDWAALNELIDVKAEKPVPSALPDLALPVISKPEPTEAPRTKTRLPAVFGTQIVIPPIPATNEGPIAVSSAPEDDMPSDSEERDATESVSELEQALFEQISRAATQGLLEADLPDVDETVEAYEKPRVPIADDVPMDVIPTEKEPETHFAVSTSIDRARLGALPERNSSSTGQSCLPAKFFGIEEWGDPLEEGSDIGTFRAGLITEYDTTDADGATALVRHYVYTSFGAEARALLRYYRDLIDRPDILDAMAQIMDDGHSDQAEAYVDQMACDGPVSLWATLAQPKLFVYQTVNTQAVMFEFMKLPVHLRRLLGPVLVQNFLDVGDKNTASAIKAAIDRVREGTTENFGMMDAAVALSEGDTARAEQSFDSVIQESDSRLPEALLARASMLIDAGEAAPDDFISLLESVAYENRGGDAEITLRQASALAVATNGNVVQALSTYDRFTSDFGFQIDGFDGVRTALFEMLLDRADDTDYLTELVLRKDDALLLPSEKRRAQASRLLDLGVPELAKELLASAGIPEPADRIMLARAVLLQRRPDVALGYLAGLDSDEALGLKAQAYRQMSDHAAAQDVFEKLGRADDQRKEAWRGGQWENLAEIGEGVTRDASLMMLGAGESQAEASDKPLAARESLIENSKANRQTVEALLSTVLGQ